MTIATNMAGRGTDIKLGKALDLTAAEAGLQIIGTERHESRRIDRQLRGRAGRQGDPGASQFFLSLEDDLMRLFGTDRIARYMDRTGAEEGEVITGALVTRAIEGAQKRVELQNFQQRKRLLEYDDVMNQQREVVYSLRLFALERGEELKAEARRMIEAALDGTIQRAIGAIANPDEWDRDGLKAQLLLQYLVNVDAIGDARRRPTSRPSSGRPERRVRPPSSARSTTWCSSAGRSGVADVDMQVLSQVMLSVLDEKWKDHLYDLDQLRNAIHYRSYGQKDPLVEYKREAYDMFEDLMRDIHGSFTERYLKIQVTAGPTARPAAPPPPTPTTLSGPSPDDLFSGPAPRAPAGLPPAVASSLGPVGAPSGGVPEVGRNDPCPCGSGQEVQEVPWGAELSPNLPPDA